MSPVEYNLLTIQNHIIHPRCLKVDTYLYLSMHCIVDLCLSCCLFFTTVLYVLLITSFSYSNMFKSYFVLDSPLRNIFSSEDICRAIHITFNTPLYVYANGHLQLTRNIPLHFFQIQSKLEQCGICCHVLYNYWIIPDKIWNNELYQPMKSDPIATKVVNSNPTQARCTRYNSMG